MTEPLQEIEKSIQKIWEQLEVNTSYFSESDRVTLELLQSHIEVELRRIEINLKKVANND